MQHPDEGMIHTWLDGELAPDEASSLEAHIADCPECSAKVAEARGLVAASSRIVSALDLVPSGVIPAAAPRRRAWYAGTQFRAAAAVMIVAGASFLVLRDRDEAATMNRVMTTAATPIAEDAAASATPTESLRNSSPDQSAATSAPAPVVAPRVKGGTARRLEERPSSPPPPLPQANESRVLNGKVAGVQAEADMVSPRADSAANRMATVPADRLMSRSAKGGVVGGVARGAELRANVAPLRKIRSDSTQATSRTVFEVSAGVEVTLTDAIVAAFDSRMKQQSASTGAAAAPPPTAPTASTAQRDAAKPVPVNTISWIDKRGHLMTLAGPLPKEQLEQLRQRLPEDQR